MNQERARSMQRISSRMTFFSKTIFPVIWFGFLGIFVVMTFIASKSKHGPPLAMIAAPLIMAALGFLMMKKLVWDLADEVRDGGSFLVVRFGRDEERILLSNIVNVSYAYTMNPPKVTLTLRTPSRFGNEVSFSPPVRFIPFAKSPVVADIIQRVDAARRAS
jgi:1,4-dihydroxy-2-naphthoate octaprenyltransferase